MESLQLQVNDGYFDGQRLHFERWKLESIHGKAVWTTDELNARFEIALFMGQFCVVREKSTGKMGSVEFRHEPRLYFDYRED